MTKPVHPGEQEGRAEPTSQGHFLALKLGVYSPYSPQSKDTLGRKGKGTVSARVEGSTREDTHRFFFCTYITCNKRHRTVEAGEVNMAQCEDPFSHPQ